MSNWFDKLPNPIRIGAALLNPGAAIAATSAAVYNRRKNNAAVTAGNAIKTAATSATAGSLTTKPAAKTGTSSGTRKSTPKTTTSSTSTTSTAAPAATPLLTPQVPDLFLPLLNPVTAAAPASNTPTAAQRLVEDTWNLYMPDKPIWDLSNTVAFDRRWIRGNRDKYNDVNSFIRYIQSNPESEEAGLLRLNGYTNNTGGLDVDLVYQMLNNLGIRGNLGRRDSGRLANVLSRLRALSTYGTPENIEFMKGAVDQYNNNRASYFPTGKMPNKLVADLNGNIDFVNGLVFAPTQNYGVSSSDFRSKVRNFLEANKDIFTPNRNNNNNILFGSTYQ